MLTLAVVVMAAEYACVFIAILIDLRSGTLKAKRNGLKRTSRGYRRTVEKASRYFITLLALSVLDVMCVVAALGLRSITGWAIPPFPFFTTVGAVGLVLIEIHSVVENSQRRSDFTEAARSLTSLLEEDAVKKLLEFLDKYK
ncbi:MAG: phage holin family protein [Muribaculaceae bacterium]|nr:phage holin family protein [Muribaculaceae bacterium]